MNRKMLNTIVKRISGERRFVQVLAGPRQVGKTTLARAALAGVGAGGHYASADDVAPQDTHWINQQWDIARRRTRDNPAGGLLVLDEIQKIPGWSETVKRLWDTDTAAGTPLQVVILGSAPLLLQRGLGDSLAGRFEVTHVTHWSSPEMREAFGWDVDQYMFFGGYPGAASLTDEFQRWRSYVTESLIETTVSRDILLMTRVDKPALLRRMFMLACEYSGRELSYQKMTGQLQDAGNTTTLAHYLDLLQGAGLATGLQKYAGEAVRRRASSPKLLALNTALISALEARPFTVVREDGEAWGRRVESSVGAHLFNTALGTGIAVEYWREGNDEVDFVLHRAGRLLGIEVKSGRRANVGGLTALKKAFPSARLLTVGTGGVPFKEFLSSPAEYWLEQP